MQIIRLHYTFQILAKGFAVLRCLVAAKTWPFTGKTTVMHLVPRESLPEPSSQDDLNRKKTGRSRCCGAMTCTVL